MGKEADVSSGSRQAYYAWGEGLVKSRRLSRETIREAPECTNVEEKSSSKEQRQERTERECLLIGSSPQGN